MKSPNLAMDHELSKTQRLNYFPTTDVVESFDNASSSNCYETAEFKICVFWLSTVHYTIRLTLCTICKHFWNRCVSYVCAEFNLILARGIIARKAPFSMLLSVLARVHPEPLGGYVFYVKWSTMRREIWGSVTHLAWQRKHAKSLSVGAQIWLGFGTARFQKVLILENRNIWTPKRSLWYPSLIIKGVNDRFSVFSCLLLTKHSNADLLYWLHRLNSSLRYLTGSEFHNTTLLSSTEYVQFGIVVPVQKWSKNVTLWSCASGH